MEKHSITEQQLLDFIEGKCSANESRIIKDAIDSSTELNNRYQSLFYMEKTMSAHNIIKTPSDFMENVMIGLESRNFSLDNVFDSINKLGIKLLGLMLALMSITLYFITNGSISLNFDELMERSPGIKNYNLDIIPVNTLLNDRLILNGLLFSGLIIMLVLFDKAVLKPWFARRSAIA